MAKTPLQKAKKQLWELCREITKAIYGNVCYSCGARNLSGSNWQTGHFIPKSICSAEIAYSLDNLRPQCSACNIWKSGNWVEFERHLVEEKGEQFIKDLKLRNQKTKGQKFDLFWYNGKIKEYEATLLGLR